MKALFTYSMKGPYTCILAALSSQNTLGLYMEMVVNLKKCLYCSDAKEETFFNREHVIPQSMGKFTDNLVLNCVCKACNDYFSASTDGILARDSIEALLRFKYGLKSLDDLSQLKGKRLTINVPSDSGPWSGAFVELFERDGEIMARPFPQIGFRNKESGQYEFLLYEQLRGFAFASNPKFDSQNFKILASTDDDLARLKLILEEAGWDPKIHGTLPSPTDEADTLDLVSTARIDRRMKRAVAKIGFNYFAYTALEKGLIDLLDHPDLCPVKTFIRYDLDPAFDPVEVTNEPILGSDKPNYRQTNSHLAVLDWFMHPNGRKDLEVSVSLFNSITYRIVLISNYSPRPLPDLERGHQFDISSKPRRCIPLVMARYPSC